MAASGDRVLDRTRTLLRGIESSGLCVIYHDCDLRVRMVENLPPSWPGEAVVAEQGDAAAFDPFTAERLASVKREVLETGRQRRVEAMQHRDGDQPLWFEFCIDRDDGPDGAARGLFVAVTDITLSKRREAALRELLYEVSHRSRNLLAILQSILGQTAHNAASVAEFEEKFRGRIASLAQSQDLITYANWHGVRLRRLVDVQTEPFCADGVAIELNGVDPTLPPNAALHLGLALHELAANSRAFGVLADGTGRIEIGCAAMPGGHRVTWLEEPRRRLEPVETWGFGRTILLNVAPRALRAGARYAVAPEGVRYEIDLPAPEAAEAAE